MSISRDLGLQYVVILNHNNISTVTGAAVRASTLATELNKAGFGLTAQEVGASFGYVGTGVFGKYAFAARVGQRPALWTRNSLSQLAPDYVYKGQDGRTISPRKGMEIILRTYNPLLVDEGLREAILGVLAECDVRDRTNLINSINKDHALAHTPTRLRKARENVQILRGIAGSGWDRAKRSLTWITFHYNPTVSPIYTNPRMQLETLAALKLEEVPDAWEERAQIEVCEHHVKGVDRVKNKGIDGVIARLMQPG